MTTAQSPGQLKVEVRLLPEPCLWCWEIRDADRGQVVESSWAAEWAAYPSPEEAFAEGRRRLLGWSTGGASRPRRPEAA